MRLHTLAVVLILAFFPVSSTAQTPGAAILRITVVDPSGAVIVGATVTMRSNAAGSAPVLLDTGGRGDAVFGALEPGRYSIHVESAGFEPYDAGDVRVRPGDNRREVKMRIAKLAETIQVGRDPRERASDPRGDAFATVLGQSQIDELPDDPDEMEQMLKDMAGPGAMIRVNGFRGGKLPPKSQIQQIRFRRNMFAADTHEPGFVSVDITTKPGLDNWRGTTNVGFRDSALSARNAFAPVKGDEQHERYGFNLNGPLWKKHTSLAVSAEGVDAFDAKTIVAALPSGYLNESIQRPNDALNVSARLEHSVTKSQMLRAEVQRNRTFADNLGVGDFDLPERGYSQTRTEQLIRGSIAGAIRKAMYNEFRAQWRTENVEYDPKTGLPAVLVLNAFDTGGAQIDGSRQVHDFLMTDDLDIAIGRHAVRTGLQLEGGRHNTAIRRNTGGTFTFSGLDAYNASAPTTFTRNSGDPVVDVTQVQAGLYIQDDFRARKDLTLSGGFRQEIQSHIGGFHLAPRGGIVWSPFKSGKTTVRGGGGIFFDWFDAQTYEQVVQLDGTHQQIETIVQPGFPNPREGEQAQRLPPGRVQLAEHLDQPELREAMAGIEQQLAGAMRLQAMYIHRQGVNILRAVNINTPEPDGRRPDPLSGPIGQIESVASSRVDALSLNFNYMKPERRLFLSANYTFARSVDETDSALTLPANSYDLAAERGPSMNNAQHRFMSIFNTPLRGRFRLGTSVRVQSALPYNITTGHDDNGDTVSNDRPAGVTRNSARGGATVDVGARLSWSVGFGGPPPSGPQGPQVRILRGDNADPLGGMGGAEQTKRYSLEFYAQGYNLLNHTNPLNFSGVMTSPFFGQATSAAAPRRFEIGTRFVF